MFLHCSWLERKALNLILNLMDYRLHAHDWSLLPVLKAFVAIISLDFGLCPGLTVQNAGFLEYRKIRLLSGIASRASKMPQAKAASPAFWMTDNRWERWPPRSWAGVGHPTPNGKRPVKHSPVYRQVNIHYIFIYISCYASGLYSSFKLDYCKKKKTVAL